MKYLFELPPFILDRVDLVITWIGFSTVVGLIGSNIVLRRNPPNSIITVLIGYAGTIIGWAIAKVYFPVERPESTTAPEDLWRATLLSPIIFVIGLLGTIGLLFLYKIIAKNMAKEK